MADGHIGKDILVGTFIAHEPCPKCGSKDNLARYDDGSAYCWGCKHWEGSGEKPLAPPTEGKPRKPLLSGTAERLSARGIDQKTCEKFGYLVCEHAHAGVVQAATYCDPNGRRVAQKIRPRDKKMWWVGNPDEAGLYGQHLWRSGGKRLVITEGEIDALSVAQVFGLTWAVVSVPSGAGGARQAVAKQLDWVQQFDEVVLLFDMDEDGQAAAKEVAELLPPGKAKIGTMALKDANELLQAGRWGEIKTAVYDARTFRPDGVVRGKDTWDLVSEPLKKGLEYPWQKLTDVTWGQRQGEIVVWCAGTGIGKSTFVKEIGYDLAMRHRQNVGFIGLEENVRRGALDQMSIHTGKRLHLPGERAELTDEQFRKAWIETLGNDRFHFYDHFGTLDPDVLLPKIRYWHHACNVRWVILDHISIMVSGMATDGDERKRIDKLMTDIRTTVEELNIGLHLVSHLRKASGTPHEEGGRVTLDDLRGSGSLKQLPDIIIGVERDQQAQSEAKRKTNFMRALKNRYSGDTGPAGNVVWDGATGRLVEGGAPFDAVEEAEREKERFGLHTGSDMGEF